MAKSCPKCKIGVISLGEILVAKPTGTYSIAGAQDKVVVEKKVIVSCSNCDLNVTGRLENATIGPDGVFTGGHFVQER